MVTARKKLIFFHSVPAELIATANRVLAMNF